MQTMQRETPGFSNSMQYRDYAVRHLANGVSSTPRPMPEFDRMMARSDLNAAAALADFFVVLVPLSPETQGIVNAPVLAAMKPSAYLINVARGGV